MFRSSSWYFPLQDKESPVLPSPTSLAFSGQTGRSPRDFNPLHFYQEEKAEWGQWIIFAVFFPSGILVVYKLYLHQNIDFHFFPLFFLHKYCIGQNVKPMNLACLFFKYSYTPFWKKICNLKSTIYYELYVCPGSGFILFLSLFLSSMWRVCILHTRQENINDIIHPLDKE